MFPKYVLQTVCVCHGKGEKRNKRTFAKTASFQGAEFSRLLTTYGHRTAVLSSATAAIHSSPLKERSMSSHKISFVCVCVEGHSSTFSRLVQPDCGVDGFQSHKQYIEWLDLRQS